MKDTDFNINTGDRPRLAWVNVDLIMTDNNYQRDLVSARVKKILKSFSWRYFQPVTLAPKSDGTYAVLDGQHRVEAAKLHPTVSEVPASIIEASCVRDEADTFVKVNTERSSVSTIDRFWAGLVASDDDALSVQRVVTAANCQIAPATGVLKPRMTNAVGAVSRAIRNYGDKAVIDTMKTICAAWPEDGKALKGTIITGLSRVLRANPDADLDHITHVLKDQDMATFTANAEAIRKISGGTADTAIAKTIIEQYNRSKRKKLELVRKDQGGQS
ncbi:DUF6551 family protein [uncultured Cohaesibacter sp.]|uniref:DUF6551 family protein n=1 Tax=uncultured Cohaesibacter sp. TaxID=1002546 RepID=UPI0029C61C7B|nr:DUF6551 family protein [uncultured Cohaesibacter sp.]